LVAAKKDTSCSTPSSKTAKSFWPRPVTKRSRASVTMTFNDTTSTALRNVP
jgi:hypothetical protein